MIRFGRTDLALLAVLASLCAFGSSKAAGQEVPQFRTAVPESPAFTFLGATPDLVSRPSSIRDLGAALLSGIGPDGKVQQGFALDATPWIFIPGLSIPLDAYDSSVLKRGLANLQLSVGTVRAAGDTASTDLALGLRTTLFDGTDAMQDDAFTAAIAQGLRGCVQLPPGDPEERQQRIQECSDSVMSTAWRDWAEYSADHWNAGFLALGAGVGLRLIESEFDAAEYSGVRTWLVGGFGVGSFAQVLNQLTFMSRPSIGDEASFEEFTYGGRLLLGGSSFNAFGEILGVIRSESEEGDDDGTSWSAGLEFRLQDELWISTGLGQRFDGLAEPDRVLVLVGLRFGLTSRARVDGLGRPTS